MARVLSPADVRLLMHCYAIPSPPEGGEQTIKAWLAEGVVVKDQNHQGAYRTTKKGDAWVEMICSTPMPVMVWCDPREKQ